jgi:hypothetical protein
MKMSSAPSHQHHPHFFRFRRDSYVSSSYNAEEQKKRLKAAKLATPPAEKVVIIKYADGNGRVYDLASKVWSDGKSHCWSGKHAWTYKNGTWFYGTSRWYEADGTWRTDLAADAPAVVDCETVPAFAAIKPTTGQELSRRSIDDGEATQYGNATEAPTKAVDKADGPRSARVDGAGAKPTECKKYFPSVGETLPVPCEG